MRCAAMRGCGDEESAGVVVGRDAGGLVEQGAGVEDLKDFGVRVADHAEISAAQAGEELRELSGAAGVDAL